MASSGGRDISAVTATVNATVLLCHHERAGENALRPLRSGRTPRRRRRRTASRASPVPAFRKSSSWTSPIKSTAPDGAHRHRGTCNCDALEVRSQVQSFTLRQCWRPLSTAFRAFREPAFRKSSSWNAPNAQNLPRAGRYGSLCLSSHDQTRFRDCRPSWPIPQLRVETSSSLPTASFFWPCCTAKSLLHCGSGLPGRQWQELGLRGLAPRRPRGGIVPA